MNPTTKLDAKPSISVRNIGGIDATDVTLAPGVNILKGRNATNRTSLLRAIMAALGSDNVALKGDADEGNVQLDIDGRTYTRTFTRTGQTVKTDGDPYLSDPTYADLFAFLLENNESRQAVEQDNDLRDIIMRPIDTEEIEKQIRDVVQKKEHIIEDIEEHKAQKRRLPDLRQKQTSLEEHLAEKQAELTAVEQELESLDTTVEETQENRDEFEECLTKLNEVRNDLEETRRRFESEQEQRSALKDEREEFRQERNNIPTSVQEISDLGRRIGELQERKRTLDSLLDRLQSIIQFNRDVMEDADSELREALGEDDSHVTDQLFTGTQELICWTCGSHVSLTDVESTLDSLREFREEKMAERRDINESLDDLRDEKQDIEKHQHRRKQIEQRLEQIDDRIDRREERMEDLRAKRERATDQVADLEHRIEELEDAGNVSRVLELNKQASEIELEIDELESDVEEVTDDIASTEAAVDKIPQLEDEREQVQEELMNLRNQIDATETNAVESFNNHMANILDILRYENIERIWIERREEPIRNNRRQVTNSMFDLHVVRSTEKGAAYEDTIDHLSESEREVTGLVFALAGYLVHEVHDTVPFMVLDSLEAIDAERIAVLVNYFQEYAPYLVVALLSEDAQALDESYRRITDI
jgi:DNA repair exonuclease SbcCD ATPase subunit